MLRKNPADRISSRETKDMFEFAESIYKTTKIVRFKKTFFKNFFKAFILSLFLMN
jgi:hypothetical protein